MPKQILPVKRKPMKAAILTRAHYDAIDAALRRLADLPEVIEAAELCDVDCAEYKTARKFLVGKLTAIVSKFFPSGRPAA